MIYFLLIILLLLASLFAGLTLGYFSLSNQDLEIKAKAGNTKAAKILPLKEQGNFLLCTLLIGTILSHSIINNIISHISASATTNATLFGILINPIAIAVGLSTILIVIFAEILPNAVCSIYAMEIGAFSVPIIRFFMFILYPIAKPLSIVLDKFLGDHGMTTYYSKTEMQYLVEQHAETTESDINKEENNIIKGVLSYSDKTAYDVMTPSRGVFALEKESILKDVIGEIVEKRFSRIPVYDDEKDNIVGFLHIKDLIGHDYSNKKIGDLARDIFINVHDDDNLKDILFKMLKMKTHIAFVYNEFGTLMGIVTMEDIVESVMNLEIQDEDDDNIDPRESAEETASELFEDTENELNENTM
jgi:metal transporter CNNM